MADENVNPSASTAEPTEPVENEDTNVDAAATADGAVEGEGEEAA